MRATIVILILLAIGALFLFANNKNGSLVDLSEGVIINADGTVSGNYSIKQIVELNTPYECSFNKSDPTSQVSGIFRMIDGNLRGDFDIDIQADQTGFGDASPDQRAFFASHFILKDGYTYTWTSLQNIGYKSKMADKVSDRSSTKVQAQIVGFEDKLAYNCHPWNAVLNVFDLPTGITFSELK